MSGHEVEIRVRNGVVEIEPASTAVRLERCGRWKAAVPLQALAEPLRSEDVDRTLDAVRRTTGGA